MPLLESVDLLLLLVLDLLRRLAQLPVAAVFELCLGEEECLLVARDQEFGEVPVRIASQLQVPEAVGHDLAHTLEVGLGALGGLRPGGSRHRAGERHAHDGGEQG